MQRLILYFGLGLMVLLLMQCAENAAKTRTHSPEKPEAMTIQHYKVPCQGESMQLCYLIKMEGQEDWEYFYDDIEGLDYEWGYVYKLEVSRTQIENPPQDGSTLALKVKKVLKKEAVSSDTSFELPLSLDGSVLLEKQDAGWIYFQSIPVNVSPALADQLSGANTGVFRHGDNQQSLTLLSVK